VKPYVKRGKTDAADAEAIAEAVTRPTMRFVAVKSAEQQGVLMLHKTRDLLTRQRAALINALRGHMGELGLIAAQGPRNVAKLVEALRAAGEEVPELAWFRKCRSQVTPEINRALRVKGFLVLGVTLI
jgi:transposase